MTPEDWTQLAAWADERDKRIYNRLLLNRFFQGYVTSVSGGIPPYRCQIQRVGETQADGADYLSPNPGYYPKVGDLVECVWRDDTVAYVLWPITNVDRMRFRAKAIGTSVTTLPNITALNAFTTVILNSITWDPNGDFNSSTYTYQPKQAGVYRFSWRGSIGATGAGPADMYISLFKNGGEVSRAQGWCGASLWLVATGTDEQIMNGSTDYVNLGAVQNSGASQGMGTGAADGVFLAAELVDPQ